ncbi:MAG: MFS transporter [Bacillota bacterium]|nr:MFS transporter [Bacillota bacterium]MDW7677126.1 MFS transporter [Bacillota bacterium]
MKKINSKWAVWLIFGIAYMIAFFHRYAIGVIADILRMEMGLTPASLSLLASLYFYTYGMMQIPTGMMIDAHGPRKVVITGMGAVLMGSLLFAVSSHLMLVYVARVLIGFGAATTFTSLLKIQALWFKPNEFATLSGMTSVLGNTGAILATSPFVFAISLIGWRASYVVVAFLTFILLVVLILFIQDRPVYADMDKRMAQAEQECESSKGSVMAGFKEIATNKYTWLNMIILFSVFGSYMSFTGLWGPSYLTNTYGMSIEAASAYIMVFLSGTIVGAPFIGWISDRVGKRKLILQMGLFFLSSMWFVYLFIAPHFYTRTFMTLLHFLLGFSSISPMLCFTNIKELNQKKYVGIATGFVNISPFFGTAILNSIVAWFLQSSATASNYQKGVRVYLIVCLIAFTASFFLKEAHREADADGVNL